MFSSRSEHSRELGSLCLIYKLRLITSLNHSVSRVVCAKVNLGTQYLETCPLAMDTLQGSCLKLIIQS